MSDILSIDPSGPPSITTNNTYNFKITFTKPLAFANYIETQYSSLNPTIINTVDNYVTIQFNVSLTDSHISDIQSYINNYTDPAYYLTLIETQNQCLNTTTINSPTPQIVQTFIISPQTDPTLVMADMKTIIQLSIDDLNSLQFDKNNPVLITVTLFDITRNIEINQTICDISPQITTWHTLQTQNISGPVYAWKSLQIYGLKDCLPDHDCIWQFKLSVNDTNINASLTCLQNLIYSIS